MVADSYIAPDFLFNQPKPILDAIPTPSNTFAKSVEDMQDMVKRQLQIELDNMNVALGEIQAQTKGNAQPFRLPTFF